MKEMLGSMGYIQRCNLEVCEEAVWNALIGRVPENGLRVLE